MLHSHLVIHQWPVAPALRGSVVLKRVYPWEFGGGRVARMLLEGVRDRARLLRRGRREKEHGPDRVIQTQLYTR